MSDRKLIRLGKSGIEYLDCVWNFYSGCRHKAQGVCPPDIPCWAKEFTGRFEGHYPNGFAPTFYPEAFLSPLSPDLKKPSRIRVCFMGDLFGDWVKPDNRYFNFWEDEVIYIADKTFWMPLNYIIERVIKLCPQHTFIFLTKNPAGMVPWSPFPDNCEVGFSATNPGEFIERLSWLSKIEAKVKWCSLEPLLSWDPNFKTDAWRMLDWVAIGALTGTKAQMMALAPSYPELTPFQIKGSYWGLMPPVNWLESIIKQLNECGTKVFIKDNLKKWIEEHGFLEAGFAAKEWVMCKYPVLRQECGAQE